MKKKFIFFMLLFLMFNVNVFASSATLSISSDSVYVGDTFTVTVSLNSVNSWNINVLSSGPVSDCTISKKGTAEDESDIDQTFSATCTTTGEGTVSLTLSGTISSSTSDSPIDDSKSIIVEAKQTQPETTIDDNKEDEKNTNTNSNTTTTGDSKKNTEDDKKSSNNNLKSIKVEGYDLEKVSNTEYKLTVKNSVDKIKIVVESEDNKAKVTGDGQKNLKAGENVFSIIVTAEDKTPKTYKLTVTRKTDKYYLKDLDDLLESEDTDITLKDGDIIKSSDLEKIKKVKKTISFNKFDENDKLLYSFKINGNKLEEIKDIDTKIVNDFDITDASIKNVDGIKLAFKDIPKGVSFVLNVSDKYKDIKQLNLYSYENGTLEIVRPLTIKNDLIEFDINNDQYFITSESIDKKSKSKGGINSILIVSILDIIVLIIILVIILKNKKKKKKEVKVDYTLINQNQMIE